MGMVLNRIVFKTGPDFFVFYYSLLLISYLNWRLSIDARNILPNNSFSGRRFYVPPEWGY